MKAPLSGQSSRLLSLKKPRRGPEKEGGGGGEGEDEGRVRMREECEGKGGKVKTGGGRE